MKNSSLFTMLFLFYFSNFSIAQSYTVVLQPNEDESKDAFIDSRLSDKNFGNHSDYAALAWTNGGVPVVGRGLMDFDFSNIPSNAIINKASLSLYSINSGANGSHSTQSGPNNCTISRITSNWDENTVTWDNQPYTTSENAIELPSSVSSIQHYLNINVTNLVQDMMAFPSESYGFQFKLNTENYYRRMIFASSKNSDESLRPKLEITYFVPLPSDECVTLNPNGENGKSGYIESRLNDITFEHHTDYPAISWTNGGVKVYARGLIDFNLENLPKNIEINSAMLSLYSYNSGANGTHSTQSGPNSALLHKITTSWDPATLTWNNRPKTSSEKEVYLLSSYANIQDYLNIDVTNLIIDMHQAPESNHGLQIQLVNEDFYRRLIFASGNSKNSDLHPKLEICYSFKVSNEETKYDAKQILISPNPMNSKFNFETIGFDSSNLSLKIVNQLGQVIKEYSHVPTNKSINVSDLEPGVYYCHFTANNEVITKKIFVVH